jgi:HlyD family secretion protein
MMIKKAIIAVLIIAALLGVAKWQGWIGKQIMEQVAIEKITTHTIIETVSASGKIYPVEEVKISPDVPGEIKELLVKDGDEVKAGQLLARINPETYQSNVDRTMAAVNAAKANAQSSKASLKQIEAQLSKAEFDIKRQKKLFDDKIISEQDYLTATANYKNLEAQLDAAKENISAANYNISSASANLKESNENMSKTNIVAPMSGTITQLNIEKGERVVGTSQMAGTEMMRITNLNAMEVRIDISESDVVKIHVGDSAHIKVDAYGDKIFLGSVTQVANSSKSLSSNGSVDQATTFTVKILIDINSYNELSKERNSKNLLLPGMNAGVEIFTNSVQNIIAVPIQAVTLRDDSAKSINEKIIQSEVVFVAKNGVAKLCPVKTGLQDTKFIEIKNGIAVNDEVIISPASAVSRRLQDGLKIKIVDKKDLQNSDAE